MYKVYLKSKNVLVTRNVEAQLVDVVREAQSPRDLQCVYN